MATTLLQRQRSGKILSLAVEEEPAAMPAATRLRAGGCVPCKAPEHPHHSSAVAASAPTAIPSAKRRAASVAAVLRQQAAHTVAKRVSVLFWHVPIQALRLWTFVARLGAYVAMLLPALLSVFAYWAFLCHDVVCARYREASRRNTCDIYIPAAAAAAIREGKIPSPTAPVIVMVTGGAWMIGHKGYMTLLCRALRSAGFLCIAVDHRFWPQTGIDGMAEDVDAAIEWSLRNCAAYGGDASRLVLLGHSSGAHVTSLLLARRAAAEEALDQEQANDEDAKTEEGAQKEGMLPWQCSEIFGYIGLGGVYDLSATFMESIHGKGIDIALQRMLFGDSLTLRELRSSSRLLRQSPAVAARLPPSLFIHAKGDKITPVEQSAEISAALYACASSSSAAASAEGAEAAPRGADSVLLEVEGGHNDPVTHGPFLGDNTISRALIMHFWRWSAKAAGSAEALERRETNIHQDWASAAASACAPQLAALPCGPRLPRPLVAAAMHVTPF